MILGDIATNEFIAARLHRRIMLRHGVNEDSLSNIV